MRLLHLFVLLALLVPATTTATAAPPASALIQLPSGVTLHYAVQGRPDGEPLVLLHGVGDNWRSWEPILPLIPDRYRVYAVTQRGHGLSDAPASGYTHRDFAADAAAFIRALDLRGVTLVGHSMGSFVAQAVAANDDGRLARLVLVGSGPGGAPAVAAEAGSVFAGMAKGTPGAARDFQASTTNKPIPAPFFEAMVESAARVPVHAWQQLHAIVHSAETAAALPSIAVPTLLLWGDRDALLSRADQDALLAAIRGSRLIVYPDVGHAPHWEDPQRFAADLLAFVAGAQRPSPSPPREAGGTRPFSR